MGPSIKIKSPRAGGEYCITLPVLAMAQLKNVEIKILLTSWLVEQRRIGDSCPEISPETMNEVAKKSAMSTRDRAINLLRYLVDHSDLFDKVTKFYALTSPKASEKEIHLLAWTASLRMPEVICIAEYCNHEGWIDYRLKGPSESCHEAVHELTPTPKGIELLAEIEGRAC